MKRAHKLALAGGGCAATIIVMAATAFACLCGVLVNLSTPNATAGQEVGITGTGFHSRDKVVVRFNALDGPVLTTADAPTGGAVMDSTFTVPEGTPAGSYVIIVTQENAAGKTTNAPVRAVLNVTGDGGATPVLGAPTVSTDDAPRAKGFARTDNSVSAATLAMMALGVGGVGMFLAGMAALFAGRRNTSPKAARAHS